MTSPARITLLSAVKEPDWQRQVITWAKRAGWLVFHVHDSRKQEWGTDPGFPDLVLARNGRVIFAELKVRRGQLQKEQRCWGCALEGAAEWYCWRPSDEARVQEVLA